jgi:hypothetical protein
MLPYLIEQNLEQIEFSKQMLEVISADKDELS